MNQPRVIVIGGGIAGLTAAAYAAREGARVTLFERSVEAGGRARTISENGFHFNMGPHALYRGGAGEEVLAELGAAYTHGKSRSSAKRVAVRNGRRYVMPMGVMSLVSTGLLGIRAKTDAALALNALKSVDTASLQHTTLSQWIEGQASHPASRELLHAIFRLTTYSNGPGYLSAAAAIDHFQRSQSSSVIYVDGGWQTLVDGLRRAAVNAGATIRTGTRVEAVVHDDRVRGVMIAGNEFIPADAAIIATEPANVAKLLPSLPALAGRLASLLPANAACLDVALERLPERDREFALGIDRPYYMSVHTRSARLAPEGKEIVSVAKYLPVGQENDPVADERELEAWLDTVQPGWRDVLISRRYLPSMTVMHAVATAEGGGLAGRPRTDEAGVEGLLLAGDWVGDTGMLADVCYASGRLAGRKAAATRATARELAAV